MDSLKKQVVDILIRRDGLSEKEAWNLVGDIQNQINDALVISDSDEVERIIADELALEPDFLEAFLF